MSRIGEAILLFFSREEESDDLPSAGYDWSLETALEPFDRKFPGFRDAIRGKDVLDFGSGLGWQSAALALAGARRVVGVDTNPRCLDSSRALASRLNLPPGKLSFVDHLGESSSDAFDVVLSLNSMEHFGDPAAILQVMGRALQPGGRVLISFGPPWYAPYGSHMHFFTRLPWINVLFSEQTVMAVRSRFRSDGARRYEDVEGGLNRMSIRRFEDLLNDSNLITEWVEYTCVKDLNFLKRVPVLRELFINDVVCSLTKS